MSVLATRFPDLQSLSDLVREGPDSFISPRAEPPLAALNATKSLFDFAIQSEQASSPHIIDLVSSLYTSTAPKTRSQTRLNGKRKRSSSPLAESPFRETPLSSLIINGMSDDQLWAQLELRAEHVCNTLELLLEERPVSDDVSDEDNEDTTSDELDDEMAKEILGDEDIDFSGEESDIEAQLSGDEHGFQDIEEDSTPEDAEGAADYDMRGTNLRGSSSDESEIEDADSSGQKENFRPAHQHELDDGFFDLISFNAETEQAEAKSASSGHLGAKSDSEDDDDIESVDLYAPIDTTEDMDEQAENAGEIMYHDFFAPPHKVTGKRNETISSSGFTGQVRFHKQVQIKEIHDKQTDFRVKDGKDSAKHNTLYDVNQGGVDDEYGSSDEESQQNVELSSNIVIERLKDDLFTAQGSPSLHEFSTNEKRVAELSKQIAELESENVQPKDWLLSGEAGSRSRPQNSLLEEDLEFERATKAAPIITEETVLELEDRIKARILEGRFDDVVRLRPLDNKPFLSSRFLELDDKKSAQSLAQIYENEYVTSGIDGDPDGKLKKEHNEIEQLWEHICRKLDALCNAHFVPKQPKAKISAITSVSAASLESAIPDAKSVSMMLAPEEVLAPSVVEPQARSELTPAKKRALHQKQRKLRKKSRDVLEKHVDKYAKVRSIGSIKRREKEALKSVVKHGKGVTVMGKAASHLKKK